MSNFDRWADSEHRRRFRGMGLAVFLVIIALLIPVSDGPQAWGKTQIIWLSALFFAFQFGQVWHAMRMTRARDADRFEQFKSSYNSAPHPLHPQAPGSSASARSPSPQGPDDVQAGCSNTATMSATAPAVPVREQSAQSKPAGMGKMAHENRAYLIDEDKIEIRAYANIEEAQRHGWVFGPAIATFSGQPVPETATLGAKTYAYSGLGPNRNTGLVAPDTRLFGPLSYRLTDAAGA